MKRIITLATCLLAIGCSDKRVDELQKKLDEQQARLQQLEKQVGEEDAKLKAVDAKLLEAQRYARQIGTSQRESMRLQRGHQQQIDGVRDDLAELQQKFFTPLTPLLTANPPATAVTTAPAPAYTAPISVYSQPDPAVSDFIQPPAGTNNDLFPVSVSDVRGVKVVSGSYTTTQTVPTDDTYVDDFGEKQNRTRIEEVTMPEHDYRVSYTVQNLTRTPKLLAVGAGRKTKPVTLQPGETLTDVVDSALGADLTVRIGGTVRRYPAGYDE
ncbi:MAG: hypothetical protein V1929_12290 [bacterium]